MGAAADSVCRIVLNHGVRSLICCYCSPNSTLIRTLSDRRGRRGLGQLWCGNALNRHAPLILGLTTLTPCALGDYCLRRYHSLLCRSTVETAAVELRESLLGCSAPHLQHACHTVSIDPMHWMCAIDTCDGHHVDSCRSATAEVVQKSRT